MRINITDKKECCGCTACESICTRHAILMKADELGFMYPHVEDGKCVDCGLCMKVCQFHKNYNRWGNYNSPKVYAIRNKSQEVLSESQSGAAFYTFSEFCLRQGYVVYGAVLDEVFRVKHLRGISSEDRDRMLNSKYVQSDMRGIYKKVKEDLIDGTKVLFSGTPCQVAGLKAFLGQRWQQNLITIDLVCHAVPSPAVWRSYIEWIEKKYGSKIEEVRFRDKRFGWNIHFETFKLANGKFLKRSTFRDLFYTHYMVRESCSNCPFTNLNRVGDVSIGDFWGWFSISDRFNDNRGVSLLLVNSDQGKQLLDSCVSELEIIESNTKECLQPQLKEPIKLNPQYRQFIRDFSQKGFEYVGKKYADLGWRHRRAKGIEWLKRVVKKIICFR